MKAQEIINSTKESEWNAEKFKNFFYPELNQPEFKPEENQLKDNLKTIPEVAFKFTYPSNKLNTAEALVSEICK